MTQSGEARATPLPSPFGPASSALASRVCGVGLVVLPLVLLLAAVVGLGVNAVVADELHYVDFIRLLFEGGDWPSWLWQQHNEHRVLPLKLLMALLAGPTRWSQRAEMLCSVALCGLLVFALWRIHRDAHEAAKTPPVLVFAPVAWLACSLAQYENQFYGLMVCHYFTVACGVAALWLLGRRGRLSAPLAVLAASVSATSVANGLLLFPAGIALLAARRSSWRRWLLWCASGALIVVLYLRDYVRPPHARAFPWEFASLPRVGIIGVGTVGAPLAGGSLAWSLAFGAAIAMLALLLLARWLRAEPGDRARQAPAVAVLLWGVASCAMIALGRAFMVHPGWNPLISRYVTHSNLVWFGVYILLWSVPPSPRWSQIRTAFSGALLLGLVAANFQGLRSTLEWRRDRLIDQYLWQTVPLQPDAALSRLGPPEVVRAKAAYLENQRLSAFAEPQRLMVPLDARDGEPTAEVRPGRELEQRLACRIDELNDVGVNVFPAERPAGGSFSVVVASEGRELARRAIAVMDVRGQAWVRVSLPVAFRCEGRELRIRLESTDVDERGGIRALGSQPFYAGSLSQGGEAVAGRQLGVALNGYRYGIVRDGL